MNYCENLVAAGTVNLKHAVSRIEDELAGIGSASSNCSTAEEHARAAKRLEVDIKNIGNLVAALHDAAKAHEMIAVSLEMKNEGGA